MDINFLRQLAEVMLNQEGNDFAENLAQQSMENHQQKLIQQRLDRLEEISRQSNPNSYRLAELQIINQQKDQVIMQLQEEIHSLKYENKIYRAELSRVGNGLQKELEDKKETIKAMNKEMVGFERQRNDLFAKNNLLEIQLRSGVEYQESLEQLLQQISAEKRELAKKNKQLEYEVQKLEALKSLAKDQGNELEAMKAETEAPKTTAMPEVKTIKISNPEDLKNFLQALGSGILSEVSEKYEDLDKTSFTNAANKAKEETDALVESIKNSEFAKKMVNKVKEAEADLSKAMKKQDSSNVSVNESAVQLKEKMDASTINITKQSILINYLDLHLPELQIKKRVENGEQIYILTEEDDGSILNNCIMQTTYLEPAVKTSIMCSTGANNVLAIMSK